MSKTAPLTYQDVRAAADQIRPLVHRTPVMTSSRIDQALSATVFFKCENLQRSGSFKFRGACNALAGLTPEQRRAGVVSYSSGNHAQALALAAQTWGTAVTIVMPHDAPAGKLAAARGYGAEIIGFDRYTEDREQIGLALAHQRGLTLVPPYDDPHVIAGQGTAAGELLEEAGELDALIVPVGGGGLLAGSALAAEGLAPRCLLFGVEPEAGNDAQQSLRAGRIVRIQPPRTLADGAATSQLGEQPFAVIRERAQDILTVTDQQLIETMRVLAGTLKMVVEPTGCLGLAALLASSGSLRESLRGRRIGVILSGGNVDLARLATLLG